MEGAAIWRLNPIVLGNHRGHGTQGLGDSWLPKLQNRHKVS